jgi:ABC-type sugar transport system substrate-binding protein
VQAVNRAVGADVPASKRLAFVGTDWYDVGTRQGEAVVRGCKGGAARWRSWRGSNTRSTSTRSPTSGPSQSGPG